MEELTKVAEIISTLGEQGTTAFSWWIVSKIVINALWVFGIVFGVVVIAKTASRLDE